MLMDADAGEGGVKNSQKSADVLYGRTLTLFHTLQMPLLKQKLAALYFVK